MLEKKYRKKQTKAAMKCTINVMWLLLGIIIFIIGLPFFPFGLVLNALGIWLIIKYASTKKAIKNLKVYGPLIVNNPEYTINDISKAVGKDSEEVIKDFEKMQKAKLLYGNFDPSGTKFVIDDDFNLSYFLMTQGWANAIN